MPTSCIPKHSEETMRELYSDEAWRPKNDPFTKAKIEKIHTNNPLDLRIVLNKGNLEWQKELQQQMQKYREKIEKILQQIK